MITKNNRLKERWKCKFSLIGCIKNKVERHISIIFKNAIVRGHNRHINEGSVTILHIYIYMCVSWPYPAFIWGGVSF